MTQPAPFYPHTWDTSFLELPRSRMLLSTYETIPTRPTAKVELHYYLDTQTVTLMVVESNQMGTSANVIRFSNVLEYSVTKFDPESRSTKCEWRAWHSTKRFSSEVEALCWMVLCSTDVGCPAQARSDMPEAIKSPLWNEILEEMKRLGPVASVMLS